LSAGETKPIRPAAGRQADCVIARCRELALCTDVPATITRTFLAPSMHRVHALVGEWMRAAGMNVSVDAAGNLRGLLAAADPRAPRLIIGSHLDTVANAGAFDGILGVILGVALAQTFAAETAGQQSPFAIEVIGFSEEEGVRFGKPFLGSLALIGQLDPATLALTDANGVSVASAIRDFGLDPAELPAAVIDPSAFAYLEFHIEQGPVLESEGHAIAVVDAIAGQTRMEFTFTGHANHAGTTPMGPLRHDALAAAAEWIVEVERYANACDGLVATVAKVDSSSRAGNVIAGRFVASLDVRHADNATRSAAVSYLADFAQACARSRGVSAACAISVDQPAVSMDTDLSRLLFLIASIAAANEVLPRFITSGAGHDAMVIARRVPSAMLFLRSPGGLSHHPNESVLAGDVAAAFTAGLSFLRTLRDDKTVLEGLLRNAILEHGKAAHA